MRILIPVVWCLTITFSQAQTPASFIREAIEFRLTDKTFSVNGIYVFINNTDRPVTQGISYPFPVSLNLIDTLHIVNMVTGQFLTYEVQSNAVHTTMSMAPRDTVLLNIFYRQRSFSDTLIYILTSTRKWKKPLQQAEFILIADTSCEITGFSYPPDKMEVKETSNVYLWQFHNFLPQHDFQIYLEEKP